MEINVLFSSPSDTYVYKEDVNKAINDINDNYSTLIGNTYKLVDWRKDTYPDASKEGQQAINNQIVNNSDVCIALFANRLGTPTNGYYSGTDEEIQRMKIAGKQVMVFRIMDSSLTCSQNEDNKLQKEKMDTYWEKMKGHSYCREIRSVNDIQKDVFSELRNLIKNENNIYFIDSSGCNEAMTYCIQTTKIPLFHNKKDELAKLLIATEKIELIENGDDSPTKFEMEDPNFDNPNDKKSPLTPLFEAYRHTKGIEINQKTYFDEEFMKSVCSFAQNHNITIPRNFCDVGHGVAYSTKTWIGIDFGNYFKGTDKEIRKLQCLFAIKRKIKNYLDWKRYLESLEKIEFVSLKIKNCGKQIYRDIHLAIKIPFLNYINFMDLPKPDDAIFEEWLNLFIAKKLFSNKGLATDSVFINNNKIPLFNDYRFEHIVDGKLLEYTNDLRKQDYFTAMKNVFSYEHTPENGFIVLLIKIPKIVPSEACLLPSLLPIKGHNFHIEYELFGEGLVNRIKASIIVD